MSRSRAQKRQGRQWQSLQLNERQYAHYWQLLCELSVNRFKWHNLPEGVDERFLEVVLHQNGVAAFFKPWFSSEFMATRCTTGGKPNVYDNPTTFNSYGNNAWFYKLGLDTGVLIWQNRLRMPVFNSLDLYSRRLANIDRTIDVNVNALKNPLLMQCPEEKRVEMTNLYKQYDGNEPVIIGSDMLMEGVTFGALRTEVKNSVTDLMDAKSTMLNEMYTFLGIDNANTDKRERLVTDEVQANNGQIELARLSCLNARREACLEINKRYGLEVSVTWAADNYSDTYDMLHNVMLQSQGGERDTQ